MGLIKPFFVNTKKSDKNLDLLRRKVTFHMNEETFFINFEGLSLKQINKFFW